MKIIKETTAKEQRTGKRKEKWKYLNRYILHENHKKKTSNFGEEQPKQVPLINSSGASEHNPESEGKNIWSQPNADLKKLKNESYA